jgi:hypothetical protein
LRKVDANPTPIDDLLAVQVKAAGRRSRFPLQPGADAETLI